MGSLITAELSTTGDRSVHKGVQAGPEHPWLDHAVPVLEHLWFFDGSLNSLNNVVAGLEGVIFCKDVTHIFHAGLNTFGHKAKHPVKDKKKKTCK